MRPLLCYLSDPAKSAVAFVVVVGSTAALFAVPLVAAALFAGFIALSFWPVVLVVLPFAAAGAALGCVCTAAAAAALWWLRHARPAAFAELAKLLRAWALLMLPYHAVFATAVVSVFSFGWSLAIGACLLLQGEVKWDRGDPDSVRRWPAALDLFEQLMGPMFDYFPMSVHVARRSGAAEVHAPPAAVGRREAAADDAPVLLCYHPHGIYAFGLLALVFGRRSGFAAVRPGSRGVLVGVASALLHVPFFGSLVRWFGFLPAGRRSIDAALETGFDVALVPGGIAEMLIPADPSADTLFLSQRRGFCAAALRHGRGLVPVYGFGEPDTFVHWDLFASLRALVSRRLGVAVALFRGRWGTLTPFPVPVRVVVGAAIPVARVADPTREQVDELHDRYVAAVRRLYDDNRHLHPRYHTRELRIV